MNSPALGFIQILFMFRVAYSIEVANWDSGLEWVDSDDITLKQLSWIGDFNSDNWESSISLAYGDYQLDYQPVAFDFNGEEKAVSERIIAIQFNSKKQLGDHWWLSGGAGAYDGFTNYRSVWLDEYYRQQFSELYGFPGAENYVEADPKGINATAGTRWEYQPGNGFAQFSISALRDDVSPGYEIDFDGLRRGELTLDTVAASLSTENILTKNIRSFLEFRVTQTTDRSTRYGVGANINVAHGEQWVSRWNVGGSKEDPQFEAFYGGVALEYQASDKCYIFVDGWYYEDTGEIENALLFTSAAPGLESSRVGIGVRWIGDQWSMRIYAAPLENDYEPTNPGIDFFQNLYSDRDWTIAQIAVSRSL
ncbi:MAG: hypothetical protein O3C43_14480 [Verrucomicrobia bacterium]|nr:hypothetical protein [Verrucomicrobiota bacterium]